jgi:aminoglycoside 6'-N-acetyltransferase I
MSAELLKDMSIRPLEKNEAVPFELLLDADPSMAAIEKYLPLSEIYVAVIKDTIAGVIVLHSPVAGELEIKNIAIREEYQGKGIGTYLLKWATRVAVDKKYKALVIGTSNASTGQLCLYQKNGFEITGILCNFFLNNYPEPIFENGIRCKHMIVLKKMIIREISVPVS